MIHITGVIQVAILNRLLPAVFKTTPVINGIITIRITVIFALKTNIAITKKNINTAVKIKALPKIVYQKSAIRFSTGNAINPTPP